MDSRYNERRTNTHNMHVTQRHADMNAHKDHERNTNPHGQTSAKAIRSLRCDTQTHSTESGINQ
jgi:myo-inositol-hexaphosphate 3-phosphohydrolase